MFGILVGNFANILYSFTKPERDKIEDLDMINQTMYSLQLPVDLQSRVIEYYDIVSESRLEYNKKAFQKLNHCLANKIFVSQCSNTFSRIWETDSQRARKIKNVAEYMEIKHFQSGDIILKQGERGTKVCFIIDGLTEIILENEDFQYYQQK
jgi:hypothetical protein